MDKGHQETSIVVTAYNFATKSLLSCSKILGRGPIWGRISTAYSSPWLRASLGVRPIPTPEGVPVMMTVPGGRVVPWDSQLMILGTEKIKSLGIVSKCICVTGPVTLTQYHSPGRPRHS